MDGIRAWKVVESAGYNIQGTKWWWKEDNGGERCSVRAFVLAEDLCHAVISLLSESPESQPLSSFSNSKPILARSPCSTFMSGKAPPRGPRALLGSLPPSAPHASHQHHQQPQQQQNHPASSSSSSAQLQRVSPITTTPPNRRIGAVPPTGPRSLNGRQPPPGPKHLLNGHSSLGPGLPSSSSHGLQSNRHPISIKGKNPDKGPVAGRSGTSVWK